MIIVNKNSQLADNQNIKETIAFLRRAILALRNGETVRSMAEKGVRYRKNCGVSLADLNKIAENCVPNAELAQQLWQSDAREEMILAACLVPHSDFTLDEAMDWAKKISQVELAEIVSMKLFAKLPFAATLAENLMQTGDEMQFLIGLSTATRIVGTSSDDFCENVCQFLAKENFNNLTICNLKDSFRENLLFFKPHFDSKNLSF